MRRARLRPSMMIRAVGQRWRRNVTAALLLVLLLLIPVVPLLSASSNCSTQVCACCRRKDHRNCGMGGAMSADGPAWDATPQCGCGCQQLLTFLSSLQSLTPNAPGAVPLCPAIFHLAAEFPPRRTQASLFAWRHQRPPPLP